MDCHVHGEVRQRVHTVCFGCDTDAQRRNRKRDTDLIPTYTNVLQRRRQRVPLLGRDGVLLLQDVRGQGRGAATGGTRLTRGMGRSRGAEWAVGRVGDGHHQQRRTLRAAEGRGVPPHACGGVSSVGRHTDSVTEGGHYIDPMT